MDSSYGGVVPFCYVPGTIEGGAPASVEARQILSSQDHDPLSCELVP